MSSRRSILCLRGLRAGASAHRPKPRRLRRGAAETHPTPAASTQQRIGASEKTTTFTDEAEYGVAPCGIHAAQPLSYASSRLVVVPLGNRVSRVRRFPFPRRSDDIRQCRRGKKERMKVHSAKKIFAAFVCFLFSTIVFAQAGEEVVRVKGSGVGTDRIEALKDAYRDAVERAVGLYVDAEQMVENEDLVKDQILTHSNAYIESYKISKEVKSENGHVSITILADVRKLDLAKKIRDTIPDRIIDISGASKDLHAQITTSFKADDDALLIVRNELKDLQPLKQLMKATLESAKPIVESVKEDSSMVRLWYPVKIEVDASKYYKEFVPRWSRILDQIKTSSAKRWGLRNNHAYVKAYNDVVAQRFGTGRKGLAGVMTRCSEKRDPRCAYAIQDVLWNWGVALNEEYNGMSFLDTRILDKPYVLHGFGLRGFHVDGWPDGFAGKGKRIVERAFAERLHNLNLQRQIDGSCTFLVGLVTAAKGDMLSGKLYKIPPACADEIVAWQHRVACGANEGCDYRKSAPEVEYVLRLVDNDGGEVAWQIFSLRNLETMNTGCVLLEDTDVDGGGGKRLWFVSPLVGGFAKGYVKWVSVDVAKDDVAKISHAKISVEE